MRSGTLIYIGCIIALLAVGLWLHTAATCRLDGDL